jgi:hypothetical protein
MNGMLPAELAVLLDLYPVGMSLLILCCIVIAALAFCAGKCDPCTHFLILLNVK